MKDHYNPTCRQLTVLADWLRSLVLVNKPKGWIR